MAKEMSSCFKPMCVFGILGEALKIPFRSGKLFLSVALLFVIPTSLLLVGNIFALKPLIMDLMVKSYTLKSIDPQKPRYAELTHGIQRDIGILFGEEIVVIVAFSVIQLFAAVAMIYLSAMAFCAKNLTHKELFWKIGRTWKRPVITWLYTVLLSFGFLFPIFLLRHLVMVFFKDLIVLAALGAIIGLLLLLSVTYFSMIWKLAIVVSVMEEGGSGLGAIQKATELIKGRKLQGFLLYLIFLLLGFALSKIIDGSPNLIIGLLVVDVGCLADNLLYIVYTVFYFECKKVHGEKVEMEEGSGYSLVSTNPLVDVALP